MRFIVINLLPSLKSPISPPMKWEFSIVVKFSSFAKDSFLETTELNFETLVLPTDFKPLIFMVVFNEVYLRYIY